MYIMRGYTDDMKGTKIPDIMVVKPMNGRYITERDGEDWPMKSTDRCPTYGLCKECASSGPAGMHCQLCKDKQVYYKCPWMGGMSEPRKWIDAEWISRMVKMTHVEAGADRIQTYPFHAPQLLKSRRSGYSGRHASDGGSVTQKNGNDSVIIVSRMKEQRRELL
jgi:hypothetical protein